MKFLRLFYITQILINIKLTQISMGDHLVGKVLNANTRFKDTVVNLNFERLEPDKGVRQFHIPFRILLRDEDELWFQGFQEAKIRYNDEKFNHDSYRNVTIAIKDGEETRPLISFDSRYMKLLATALEIEKSAEESETD